MILSHRKQSFALPLTSKCIIHTTGELNDGDIVSVTSPVFSSVNFTSRAINTSETFDVVFHTSKTVVNDLKDGEFFGRLEISDNDPFNMSVSVW